jgi:hypothetical protein
MHLTAQGFQVALVGNVVEAHYEDLFKRCISLEKRIISRKAILDARSSGNPNALVLIDGKAIVSILY